MLELAHVAATLIMTGLIWFVQLVHYPLMAKVGAKGFVEYEADHVRRTGWVVIPPMLTELATAIALLASGLRNPVFLGSLGLLLLVWGTTFLVSVPCHNRLSRGFDSTTHQRLVRSNWIRTLGWSLRAICLLSLLHEHMALSA